MTAMCLYPDRKSAKMEIGDEIEMKLQLSANVVLHQKHKISTEKIFTQTDK